MERVQRHALAFQRNIDGKPNSVSEEPSHVYQYRMANSKLNTHLVFISDSKDPISVRTVAVDWGYSKYRSAIRCGTG